MNVSLQNKPNLILAIALMTLVNGIFNIIWGIGMILNTAGFLLVCFPIAPLPIILGGFEIAYALRLLSNPPQFVRPSQAIAIFEIVAIVVGNFLSLVVGILALIFYNDSTVRDYFARLNGTPIPTPPPAPVTPLPVDPAPAPIPPVESTPEVPAPAPIDPEGPKRRPRKVA